MGLVENDYIINSHLMLFSTSLRRERNYDRKFVRASQATSIIDKRILSSRIKFSIFLLRYLGNKLLLNRKDDRALGYVG